MRYAEKLDQLPVAGKAEEMRLIQVNFLHALHQTLSTWKLVHGNNVNEQKVKEPIF